MRHLSIGRAWDEAKVALVANRRLITPVVLGLVLLPTALAGLIEPPVKAGQAPPAGWLLGNLVLILLMILAQLTVVLIVNGWRGRVGEAIGRAARRLPVLIAAGLIIALPIAIVLTLVVTVMAVGSGGENPLAPGSLSPGGSLAFLVVMLLFLYITIRLLPLMVLVAEKQDGPIAAIKRAYHLSAGNFGRLGGFFLLVFAAFLILAMAVDTVVGAVATVLLGKVEPWSLSALLVALASGLVQAGFVAIYSAMLARITAQLEVEPAA